jgi:hypothetical protein
MKNSLPIPFLKNIFMRRKFVFFNFFFFLFFYASSQEVLSSASELGTVNYEKTFEMMTLQDWEIASTGAIKKSYTNRVFIEQVGNGNVVNSHISSFDATVNLDQRGDENEISLNVNAGKVEYNVVQTGNNNYLQDHTFTPQGTARLNLSQRGNENEVIKYGANSITNKIGFNIEGSSKLLIIRSF